MIRTTYPDRICYRPGCDAHKCRVLLPEGVRIGEWATCPLGESEWSCSVSSGEGVPTPCTRRRSPLRSIAYSNRGRILSSRLSTFSGYFISGIPSADISHPEFCAPTFHIRNFVRWHFIFGIQCFDILHPDISQPDGRGGRFNFSSQTYPDPLIALTRRVFLLVYSATEFLLKLPDISDRHFEIFFFRYLLSKSPNSPCNPPIIGFLSL